MIHDIEPHRYDISMRRREPGANDFVFVPQKDAALLDGGGDGFLPAYGELLGAYPEAAGDTLHLFTIDDRGYFLLKHSLPEKNGFAYRPTGSFRTTQPLLRAFAGITAAHLAGWYARTRFCGSCGRPMEHKEDERAMICRKCNLILYPAISPAVIVGVTHGDNLLLTRYATRPFRNYALVAGFLEVGECLEDTVRREVMEETGVKVKNIRYYKSQPWGFSSSMLAGFYADLDGSPEITVDGIELSEARWVPREEIPPQDVGVALTAEMIDAFKRSEYPK